MPVRLNRATRHKIDSRTTLQVYNRLGYPIFSLSLWVSHSSGSLNVLRLELFSRSLDWFGTAIFQIQFLVLILWFTWSPQLGLRIPQQNRHMKTEAGSSQWQMEGTHHRGRKQGSGGRHSSGCTWCHRDQPQGDIFPWESNKLQLVLSGSKFHNEP